MDYDLIKVFKDSVNQYKNDEMLVAARNNTNAGTKCFLASDEIVCDRKRFDKTAEIIVSKSRSFQAAEKYAAAGKKVAVLNFANSFVPGGGVTHGARAQEECLCRISTLYDSLTQSQMIKSFYKPHCERDDDMATDDVILSPDVVVFKTDTSLPALRPKDEWFKVDVLTCAAPCISYRDYSISDKELAELHLSRARRILDVACHANADVIILGAFGCGAFKNPPSVVAGVYRKVLEEYRNAFETVEFAIYCRDVDAENYTVFNSILGGECQS